MSDDGDRGSVDNLLQRAGRRAPPPQDVRDAVYAATQAAWRQSHRQRVRMRHLSMAAAVLLCVGLGSLAWLTHTPVVAKNVVAARIESVTGRSELRADSGAAPVAGALTVGRELRNGDVIRSRPGSHLILRRPGGLTIHVGPDSEIAWESPNELRLAQGVVYVETFGAGTDEAFVLVTHEGRIQHIGTRFGVQVDERRVRVMVRDGAVQIAGVRGERQLQAGLEGRLDAGGGYAELPLGPDAGPWNWMLDGPTRFEIEDRPLREVLREMSAAAGVSLVWSSTEVARDADALVLHGPPLALPPQQALDAVLLTTRYALRGTGSDNGAERFEVVAR